MASAAKILLIYGFLVASYSCAEAKKICTVIKATMDCSYIDATSMPQITSSTPIKILLLDGNALHTLNSKSFNSAPGLTNLSITHSNVKTLDVQAFSGLTKLKFLNLTNNTIKALPDEVFGENLATLEYLYLGYNSLARISQHLFDHLVNIKVLHLEQNKLTSIHDHAFNKFQNIQWISIDHNYLNIANESWFRPINKTLTHLSLNHNPWICDSRMCAYKHWMDALAANSNKSKLSDMANPSCCHKYDTTLKQISALILCNTSDDSYKRITINSNSNKTLQCESQKHITWTYMSKNKNSPSACHRILTDDKHVTISRGKVTIKAPPKNYSGRYCCSEDRTMKVKCYQLKVSSPSNKKMKASRGSSGAAVAISIITVIGVIGTTIWYCRRKRRKYGVLSDEGVSPGAYDEPIESSRLPRHQSSTVDQAEVDEAYV